MTIKLDSPYRLLNPFSLSSWLYHLAGIRYIPEKVSYWMDQWRFCLEDKK